MSKRQPKKNENAVPWWAWLITWGIMLAGIVLSALGITARSFGL